MEDNIRDEVKALAELLEEAMFGGTMKTKVSNITIELVIERMNKIGTKREDL